MYEDLASEETEAPEPEVPETEVFEPQGGLPRRVPRLLQGTQRGLVSTYRQTWSQSWNKPGEKSILEFEKPLETDLCRAETEEVLKHLL